MTIPEYDKECDCDLCQLDRQQRAEANRNLLNKEIQRALHEPQKKR